jgi:hypothetical protein
LAEARLWKQWLWRMSVLLLYVCATDCSSPQWGYYLGRLVFPAVVVGMIIVFALLWNRSRRRD